jgi:lipid-A-disaccharide synthase
MKKLVDKVIVIYPFEKAFYDKAGVPSFYAGHPLFDEISKIGVNEDVVSRLKKPEAGRIISFLPGSRKQEIVRLLPMFLRAASLIKQAIPSVRFIISCNDAQYLDLVTALSKDAGVPYQIVVGNAHEIIKASDLCMASAGTVTLQIAYFGKPMIIAYKISLLACFIAKPFLTTPYIGLVNRLAGRMIVPERLMYRDNAGWLAEQALQLIEDERKRSDCVRELSAIMEQIAKPGASARAAEEIATLLRHYYHDDK